MARIAFATSASGKSYFARHSYGPKGLHVADGDAIVAATVGWPKEPLWWKLPDAHLVQKRNAEAVSSVLANNRDLCVVWWADLAITVPILRRRVPGLEIVGVQITLPALRRNYDQRTRDVASGKSGHAQRSWDSYVGGWFKAEEAFTTLSIPILPSFDALIKRWRIHVAENANN